MNIKIASFEEKKDGFFSKAYVTFTIISCLGNGVKYEVSRRFSDFVKLRDYFL